MAEQELRELFEREYCEEFPQATKFANSKFDLDENGEYEDGAMFVGYQMWKRAKLEVRTVEIPLEYLYGADDDAINVHLEDINVKVEFV